MEVLLELLGSIGGPAMTFVALFLFHDRKRLLKELKEEQERTQTQTKELNALANKLVAVVLERKRT